MRGLIRFALRRYKGIDYYHSIMESQSIPGEYDRNHPIINDDVVARAANKYFGWGDVLRQCLRGEKSLHDMCKNAFEHIEIDEFLYYAQYYFEIYNGKSFYSEDKVDYGKEYNLKDLLDMFIDLCDYHADSAIFDDALDEYYAGRQDLKKKYEGMQYTRIYCDIEETGDREEIHEVLSKLSHSMSAIRTAESIGTLLKKLEPGYRTAEIDAAINKTIVFGNTYL